MPVKRYGPDPTTVISDMEPIGRLNVDEMINPDLTPIPEDSFRWPPAA